MNIEDAITDNSLAAAIELRGYNRGIAAERKRIVTIINELPYVEQPNPAVLHFFKRIIAAINTQKSEELQGRRL